MIEHLVCEPLKYYIEHLFTLLSFCMENGIEVSTDVEDVEYYTHFDDGEGTLCSSLERFSEDVVCQFLKRKGWSVQINDSALILPDEEYGEVCEHLDYQDIILEYNGIGADMSSCALYSDIANIFAEMVQLHYDEPLFGGFVSAYIISKDGVTLEQLHKLGLCLAAEEGAYRIRDGKLILVSYPMLYCSDFYINDTIVNALFSLIEISDLKSCL